MAEKERKQEERPYSKPTLTVYGKVTELTTIVAPKGTNADNVSGTKTGLA
jgi:hypothetical protein